jgi:glycosyltransferase involved in cell wall biosynthesis
MHILLVTHYYAAHGGGVEIVAGRLAERLARRGLHITWAASGEGPVVVPTGVTALPMNAWNITEQKAGFPYPLWSPRSLLRLSEAVRHCDLLHLHDSLYMGNAAAHVWARWHRKPVVITQHIGMIPYSRRLLRFLLNSANHTLARTLLGNCDQCVFISQKVQTYFSQFVRFRRPPQFIPNGVATELFRPVTPAQRQHLRAQLGWPRDRLVMLFVGRFVEKKGLSILHSLARRFPECNWVLAGWGPDDPNKWGLANVHSPGRLDHQALVTHYQAADLLVLPSVGEGFPLVVQEAMACGTPVLISGDTAQGLADIESVAFISDLTNDHLVPLVRGLIESPASLEARRPATAAFAQRWDWETCADQYQELFARVVTR